MAREGKYVFIGVAYKVVLLPPPSQWCLSLLLF